MWVRIALLTWPRPLGVEQGQCRERKPLTLYSIFGKKAGVTWCPEKNYVFTPSTAENIM